MDQTEVEQLLALTSEIYDAALDASLWPDVLKNACAYVGGCSANLFSQDMESRRAAVFFQWGNNPHYESLYLEKYYKINPLVPGLTFFAVGEVHSQSDIMSYDEFFETRFYKEWARPQGLIDVVGANLERDSLRSAVIAIRRSEREGRVTDDTRRRVSMIVPHVRRAIAIGQVIEFNAGLSSSLADTFEALVTAVALVDAKGEIVFANGSGRTLLEAGEVARDVQGVFTAVDPKAHHKLTEAFAAAARGDAALGSKGVAIALPGARSPGWIAHVLPLTSGARRKAGRSHHASAAVFVRSAALSTPSGTEMIAKLFGLTPGELRVLLAIVDVGGVPATADALGVSETTIKTHLQNVYTKTGVNRQADLVKLVASTSSGLT